MTSVPVGSSKWQVLTARNALQTTTDAIKQDPTITACDRPGCLECADALLGGPLM